MILLLAACAGEAPLPVDGVLAPCPSSPNCVSSQADPSDQEHYVAPLPLMSREQLASALAELPGAGEVRDDGRHLRVACDTPSGLYTDDLDAVIDEGAGVVHVRSSSRVGYGDLGVNRARVEALREALPKPP